MQTPEEHLGALIAAYEDANRDRDICPSGTRVIINRGAQAAADLIRARDAEVRADERAKVLAGFEVETRALDHSLHGVVLGRRLISPWTQVEP